MDFRRRSIQPIAISCTPRRRTGARFAPICAPESQRAFAPSRRRSAQQKAKLRKAALRIPGLAPALPAALPPRAGAGEAEAVVGVGVGVVAVVPRRRRTS